MMGELSDIRVIKEIMDKNGLAFRKDLGQNFLINPSVCPRMAEECGVDENSGVIEIGAGIGVLTRELSKKAKKVVSFEVDDKLIPVLSQTLADCENVQVIHSDVLKYDLESLLNGTFKGMKVYVCANLPYYITSPIIMHLLESRLPFESITVMVQKEAAERLCAQVGSREAGAVTAAVNYYAQAQRLFNVSKGSFMPAPKVDSTVMKLTVRENPPVEVKNEKFFFSIIKASFAQRRKTALNSISSGMGITKDKIESALAQAGLTPDIRAEKFTMENFARIRNILYEEK